MTKLASKLESYLGLSDRESSCFGDDAPEGYNESESGYFITDYEDGVSLLTQINAARSKDDANVWKILERARRQAVNDFISDLAASILNTKKSRFPSFSGLVGKGHVGSLVGNALPFVGMEIYTDNIKGAYLDIQKIGVGLNVTNADIPLHILTIQDDVIVNIESISIGSVLNTVNFSEQVKELPLWGDCEYLKYRLLLELPDGAKPYFSKLSCCGITPAYEKFSKIRGIQSSTVDGDLNYSNQSVGLTLRANFQCRNLDWLCETEDLEGYNLLKTIGKCLQWKSSVKVIAAILDSGNINRFTMMSRESLYGRRNHYNKRYFEVIEWIAENIPTDLTDCIKCKNNKIKKRQILI